MIVERATVPDQLAGAMNSLYGSPSNILSDLLVLVFFLVVYFFGLYSAYNFQKLGRLILTATTIFIFMDVDFGQHSLVGSVEGLFVSLELITFGALLSLMWLSPLAQQFRDDDDNVDDDVIEMGQEPESEPAPKKPRTRRKPTQQKDSSDS